MERADVLPRVVSEVTTVARLTDKIKVNGARAKCPCVVGGVLKAEIIVDNLSTMERH